MSVAHTPNAIKYYARTACIGAANLFSTGTMLQTFLSAHSVASELVGMLTATMSIIQMITILLFSTIVDKLRDALKASALAISFLPLFFLIMLPFTFLTNIPPETLFGAVLIAGILQNVAYGLYLVLDYRVPYQIIDMKDYGQMSSVSGIVSSIIMVLLSSLTTSLISLFDFDRVMAVMYIFSALAMAASAVISRRFRPICQPYTEEQRAHSGLIHTLKLPAFRILLLPNLMRGFNTGVFGMLATIGIHELGLNAAQSSSLSIVYTLISIFSAFIYMKLDRRVHLHKLYLAASAIMCCAMPLMLIGRSYPLFLAFYVLLVIGIGVADYTVPVLITKVIPYDCIGSYTSLRMGTHTGGVALGSMVAGAALSRIPGIWLLLISGCLQLTSSLIYYLFCQPQKEKLL